MIEARNAMIVWQPATAESVEALPGGRGRITAGTRDPEIQIFDNADRVAHRRYSKLPCSLGACLHDWCKDDAIADVFRVFLSVIDDSVIDDSVPLADAHREFLKIDVYRDMCCRKEFFGVELMEYDEA